HIRSRGLPSAHRHHPLLDRGGKEFSSSELVTACVWRSFPLQPLALAGSWLCLAGHGVDAVPHVGGGLDRAGTGAARRQGQAAGRTGTSAGTLAGGGAAASRAPDFLQLDDVGAIFLALAIADQDDPA